MKNHLFVWLVAILAVGMPACTEESLSPSVEQFLELEGSLVFTAEKSNITLGELPAPVLKYLKEHLSHFEWEQAYRFKNDDKVIYGLDLKGQGGNKQVLLNANGVLLSLGEKREGEEDLTPSQAPEPIKAYLGKNYPNAKILELKKVFVLGVLAYKVELDNDLKLYFSENGTLLGQKKGSNDDNTSNSGGSSSGGSSSNNGTTTTSTDSVKKIIALKYPGFVEYERGLEDYCKDQYLNEVGLHGPMGEEIHLLFDLKWKFLYEVRRIAESRLPEAVRTAIKNKFPGYAFKDDKSIEELTAPDTSKRYYLRLRKGSGGSDIRVMMGSDGVEVCRK
jgi:hypothetical protein